MQQDYFKHETAIVDEGAIIGKGSKIWAYSHVCSGAIIGEGCMVGERVYIGPGVKIGDNCKVQNNSLIYEGVTLEDEVFIGPNVVTTNDYTPQAQGDWEHRFREILIKKGASIGANSVIVCGNDIGEDALIGAGSVVTKSIPAKTLAYGNPAKVQRKYDKNAK